MKGDELIIRGNRPHEAWGKLRVMERTTAWRVILEVLPLLSYFRLWIPLLLYFLFKMLVLAVYLQTTEGPVLSIWALLLGGGAREALSHYPEHLLLMPVVLGRLDVPLDIFVHSIFQGMTILLFASAFKERVISLSEALKGTLRCYGPLVGVTFVASATIFICFSIPGFLLPAYGSGMIRSAAWAATTAAGLALQAIFLFASPLVLIKKRSIIQAIRGSFRIARVNFSQTLILVFIPFVVSLPALLIGLKSRMLAIRLSPDILAHLQVFSELLAYFSTLLLIGGLTIMFVRRPIRDKGS